METLASGPFNSSHFNMTPQQRLDAGIPPGLLRLSVGLEGVDVLIDDLRQAISTCGAWSQRCSTRTSIPPTVDIRRGRCGKAFAWDRPLRPSDREALADAAPEAGEPVLSVRVAGEGVETALIADPEVYFVTGPVRVHGGGPETSGAVAVASGPAPARPSAIALNSLAPRGTERHDRYQGPVLPRNSRIAALNRPGASTALA